MVDFVAFRDSGFRLVDSFQDAEDGPLGIYSVHFDSEAVDSCLNCPNLALVDAYSDFD